MTFVLALLQFATHALLDASVASLAVFIAVAIAMRVGGLSAAARHRCWSIATIFPMLAFVAAMTSAFVFREQPATSAPHASVPIVDPFDVPLQEAARPLSRRFVEAAGGGQLLLDAAPTVRSFAAMTSYLTIAALLWLGLAGLGLARVALGFARGQRIAGGTLPAALAASREAQQARVRVRMSDLVDAPMAIGFSGRTVVIPTRLLRSLPASDLRAIAAHEVAHLVRHDDWTDLAERIVCIVMWPNPLIHVTARLARLWRERSCDEWAARRIGGRTLATALWRSASLLVGTRQPRTVLAFWRGEGLVERVEALVHPAPLSRGRTALASILFATVLLCTSAVVVARASPFWFYDVRIVATGSMHDPRADFAMAKLRDGRVLVAGGIASRGRFLRTAELYDPPRAAFVTTGELSEPIAGAVATSLKDGRILLTGGRTTSGPTGDAEIFDPFTGRFTQIGRLHVARTGHTATLLRDGTVLIAGGTTTNRTATASAELYDPRRAGFVELSAMSHPRSEHSATLLADGRVLVAGGLDGSESLRSSEVYEPSVRRFASGPQMKDARSRHGAMLLADGSLLIVGGSRTGLWSGRLSSAERFDPARDRFVPAGSMREARFKIGNALVRLPNGNVMVAGGADQVEVYDRKSERFRPLDGGSLGVARNLGAAVLLDTCAVLVAGGYDFEQGQPKTTKSALRIE